MHSCWHVIGEKPNYGDTLNSYPPLIQLYVFRNIILDKVLKRDRTAEIGLKESGRSPYAFILYENCQVEQDGCAPECQRSVAF